MGVSVYPVLEKEIEGVGYLTDGKMLAKILDDEARARATELGVEPLMNFFGFDPEILFEEFDLQTAEELKERWFSAEDGLKSVNALIQDLTENPKLYSIDSKISTGAVEDLKVMRKVLEEANSSRLKWYLAIDF